MHGRYRLDHGSHVRIFPPYQLNRELTKTSYIIYGPLANGVTTVVFESTPVYPSPSRYWETVEKHKITQFYSAPTAIRLLRRLGEHHTEKHDLSSLRVLGSVGEPINPEAWNWYNEFIGKKQCAIVDTFWCVGLQMSIICCPLIIQIRQTETGSIVVTPFPGAIETKPGSATVPFFGIEPVILDPVSGKVVRSFPNYDLPLILAYRYWKETMWRVSSLSTPLGHQLPELYTKITSDTLRHT